MNTSKTGVICILQSRGIAIEKRIDTITIYLLYADPAQRNANYSIHRQAIIKATDLSVAFMIAWYVLVCFLLQSYFLSTM